MSQEAVPVEDALVPERPLPLGPDAGEMHEGVAKHEAPSRLARSGYGFAVSCARGSFLGDEPGTSPSSVRP